DAEGRAVLDDVPLGRWLARLNGRSVDAQLVQVVAGGTVFVRLSIEPGMTLRGRVLDEGDKPVAGAEIFLVRSRQDVRGSGTLAFSGAAGAFSLRAPSPWRSSGPWPALAARAPGHVSSRTWEAVGALGDVMELVLRLGGTAGALRGRVLDPHGRPLAGAEID